MASADVSVYFKPSDSWKTDNARFALYAFVDESINTWVDFNETTTEGLYKATFDEETYNAGMIICRMDPAETGNTWDNNWNKSADLATPSGNVYYTLDEDVWDYWTGNLTQLPALVAAAAQKDIAKDYTAWNTSSAMEDNGAMTYVQTLTNQPVFKGTYGYKVVVDGVWKGDPDNSGNNFELTIPENGLYTITYTFEPITGAISATAEKTADATLTKVLTVKEYTTDYADLGTMTLVTEGDDAYKTAAFTLENRSVTAGDVLKYKIVEQLNNDGSEVWSDWHGADNTGIDENYNLGVTFDKTSTYNVTFNIWLPSTNIWTDLAEQLTGYYLVGGTGAWAVGDALTKDGDTYSITIPYTSAYSFAIVPNTAVNASGEVSDWEAVVRPESQTALAFADVNGTATTTNNSQNWKFATLGDGESLDYNATITYDTSANTWAVANVATVDVSAAGYATYSHASAYKVAGVTAYTVKVEGGQAVKSKEYDVIPAGT